MIEDLIKRQDAIEMLEEQLDYLQMLNKDDNPTAESNWYGVNWARNSIADMPSAESAQKTGKWITKSDTNPYYTTWWYECSECGQSPLRDGYGQEVLSDYCPHCGCRMECDEE